jgi:alpha-tubulin suppressor-like RCC1 family protein
MTTQIKSGGSGALGNIRMTGYDHTNPGSKYMTAMTGRSIAPPISAYNHTCAVLKNGSVKCWGVGDAGRLGIGDESNMGGQTGHMAGLPTVNLGTGRTATAIAAGFNFSCALLDNASVKCWGKNNNAQLGIGNKIYMGDHSGEMGDNLPTVNLGTGRTATAIDSGEEFSCALLDNASVKCWGLNAYGQVGGAITQWPHNIGGTSSEMGDNLLAVKLGTGRTATAIATGWEHACALLDNASVKCWGLNHPGGQLGLGNTSHIGDAADEMGDNLAAIDLGTGRTAIAIAAGALHSCAVLDDSSVKCWGDNTKGQLGIGNTTSMGNGANEMGDNLPTVNLGTGRTAIAIAAGALHTCAVLEDSSVKCWGYNNRGQLGIDNTTDMGDNSGEMGDNLPTINLGTGRTANGIAGGEDHTCAVLDDSSVKCWGNNSLGRLGLDNTTNMGDNSGEMEVLPISINL